MVSPNRRQVQPPSIETNAFTMSSNTTGQGSPGSATPPTSQPTPPSSQSPLPPSSSLPESSVQTPPSSSAVSSTPPPPTSSAPPSSSAPPTPSDTSSSAAPPTSSTSQPPTSSSTPPSSSDTPTPTPSSSSSDTPTSTTPTSSNFVTKTPPPVTSVVVVTHTSTPPSDTAGSTTSSSTLTPTPIGASNGTSDSTGLDQKAKVAIGVVVPIAAIAIIAVIALFFWKKRRARREAAEERRKEVEDYAYNPNADPTIPAVGMAADNSYEMREDGTAGYRGWGSTTVGGSTGRKASTTMSGGVTHAYSDLNSPTRGNMSEGRSHDGLLDGSPTSEGEILGAMGPSAANNRGDVRRGPSNASSSYSAAGRSDGSDGGMGTSYSNGNYYDQYGQNPYGDNGYGGPNGEAPPAPVIRDNPARRNTRIENPAHYPQQSAGIAQNF